MILLLILIIILLILLAYTLWVAITNLRKACIKECPVPIDVQACPPAPVCPACPQLPASLTKEVIDSVTQRDYSANNDPLYPPLNRMPRSSGGPMARSEDTYRFLGYIINKMDKEDSWKLYGREKNRNQGEFYVTSTNKNTDIKIMVTAEMVVGSNRLRDIYDIPEELMIKHPLFAPTPYHVIVNPSSDFGSTNIYY
jgi:hypothetical protein